MHSVNCLLGLDTLYAWLRNNGMPVWAAWTFFAMPSACNWIVLGFPVAFYWLCLLAGPAITIRGAVRGVCLIMSEEDTHGTAVLLLVGAFVSTLPHLIVKVWPGQ